MLPNHVIRWKIDGHNFQIDISISLDLPFHDFQRRRELIPQKCRKQLCLAHIAIKFRRKNKFPKAEVSTRGQ